MVEGDVEERNDEIEYGVKRFVLRGKWEKKLNNGKIKRKKGKAEK